MRPGPTETFGRGDVRGDVLIAVLEAVVAQQWLDAAGIAAVCGLDEKVVRTSLDHLVNLGVISPSDDEEPGWRLIHPRAALGGLLAEREKLASFHMDELADARLLVDRLSGVFGGTGLHLDSPGIVTLHRREQVMERLAELGRDVRDEVCSFVTTQPSVEAAAEGRGLDQGLLERGVTLRMICIEAFYRDAAVAHHLLDSVSMGVKIRTRPTLPTRLLVFDRRVAVIPLDSEVAAEGAVVVEHSSIVHLFHSLFELVWKDSQPLTAKVPPSPLDGPRPMELAILNMLALGHKDEAIARATGQSTRTVRRVVAGIAVTLDARSRFDLALRAAARGWIDSPFE
ncbi:hypothetical protein [Knoellia flava]|nr:hypothetical protein [Knoellia flava]